MNGHRVTLTPAEFFTATQTALARLLVSELAGMNHASTYRRTYVKRLEEEVVGACAERAWAKFRGEHWDASLNTFHRVPDAPGSVEIRATSLETGCLVVRENDAPERWYVLITGEAPSLVVRGFLKGEECRKPEWRRDPHGRRPAWFVPQEALREVPT